MGATTFITAASGETCAEAFTNAVQQAQYDYGHAGYTGSIAEKDSWVVISGELPRSDEDAVNMADELIEAEDPRIDDKWGPAGAIPLKDGRWLFFGWASC